MSTTATRHGMTAHQDLSQETYACPCGFGKQQTKYKMTGLQVGTATASCPFHVGKGLLNGSATLHKQPGLCVLPIPYNPMDLSVFAH